MSNQEWFLFNDNAQVHTATHSSCSWWQKGVKTIYLPPYLPASRPSLPKGEVSAGWPLPVPGQLSEELGRDLPEQVRRHL
jgi:hypothetical protein